MTRSTDRPLLGIALMLGFCALAPFADALAKLLGPLMKVGQVVTLRFAFQAAILVPLVWLTGRSMRMTPRIALLVFLRTLLHIAGIGTVFTALLYLPIADAVAIAYVMPFIMLLLGHWFLNEEVGWRRLAACVVGFGGSLLVIQPAFEDVGWAALLPLAVAFIFAAYMLLTRLIAPVTDAIAMQGVAGLVALAILAPVMVFAPEGVEPLSWTPQDSTGWWLIAGMGVAGTVGHLLMTWSLRYAPASTLAPMQYVEIPMAALVGYLIFNDLPGPLATLGICITMSAGLYIVLRERATAAQRPAPAQPDRGTSPEA